MTVQLRNENTRGFIIVIALCSIYCVIVTLALVTQDLVAPLDLVVLQ